MKIFSKTGLVFLVLGVLVFSPLFFRLPPGTDPYFIAGYVRSGSVPSMYPPMFFWLMSFFPFSMLLMKITPIILSLCCALAAGLLAEKLINYYGVPLFNGFKQGSNPKNGVSERLVSWFYSNPGWLTSFLCFGVPLFVYRGSFFEEDLLGLFFCLIGLMFLVEYFEENDLDCLKALTGCFVLGLLAWRGALLFVLFAGLLGFRRKWLLGFLVIVVAGLASSIVFFGVNPIPVPVFHVWEGLPGVLSVAPSLTFALVGLRAVKVFDGFPRYLALFFGGLAFYVSRFQFLALFPLVALSVLVSREWSTEKVVWGFELNPKLLFVEVFLVSGLIVGPVFLMGVVPTQEQWNCLEQVVGVTGSEGIANEWRFGHWINFLGGSAEFSPLHNFDDIPGSNASWVLSGCNRTVEVTARRDWLTGVVTQSQNPVVALNCSSVNLCLFHRV